MVRQRLSARLAGERTRFVYCVAQRGSGFQMLLQRAALLHPAVSVLNGWSELTPEQAAEYRAWAAAQTSDDGALIVARSTDPAAPSPFEGISPSRISYFNDADLAFTLAEIEEFFADVPHSETFPQFVLDTTAGYASSVAFIRRVLAAEGEDAARNLDGTSYVPLKRHLYEQLVETLPHDQLAVLVTAAAVNATDEALLQGVLPATNVRAELRSLQARGLLVERGLDLIISPLLARALQAYRGDDIKRYAAGTIDAFVEAGDYLSAARIALEAGNTDEAIVYLSRLPADAMILS
ncbi:MAG TPA: hypothetical protein VFL13_00505, partial [Candidatus Baltobacteraceae bacterium]|nr:hypothetical protein [Candidatus Baltobacteraceae bacterium]